MTIAIQHDHEIDFPNSRGHTPCSKEYYDTYHARNDICNLNDDEYLKDLDADEYQAWSVLDEKLASLQVSGHTGKAVIY